MTLRIHRAAVAASILAAFWLTGCNLRDEGAVDYRRAPLSPANEAVSSKPEALVERYISIDEAKKDAFIRDGDTYQIVLKQGVVRHFVDDLISYDGEIAVVATVFEVGDLDDKGHPLAIDFSPDAVQKARVVYFSGDVVKGQNLNLSQLPIYGPVKYKQGNSVVVQLYAMEIDSVSDQTKSLMNEMASLGKLGVSAFATPAAGAGFDVLTQLSLALLNSSHSDIIFRYDMTFAPQYPSRYVPQDYLTEGERIFVRSEERLEDFPWDKVEFDRKTGRLLNAADKSAYRDNTYLVVDVVKLGRPSKELSAVSLKTVSDLLESIKRSQRFDQEQLTSLRSSVQTFLQVMPAELSTEDRISEAFDPIVPEAVRKVTLLTLLQDMKSSLNQQEIAKKKIPDTVTERALRIMWRKIGDYDEKLSTLAKLTPPSIKSANDAMLETWADEISKIIK